MPSGQILILGKKFGMCRRKMTRLKAQNVPRTIFLNEAAVTLLKNVVRFSESPYVFVILRKALFRYGYESTHSGKPTQERNFWTESAGSTRKNQKNRKGMYRYSAHATARSCFENLGQRMTCSGE